MPRRTFVAVLSLVARQVGETLELCIADNGRGFDPQHYRWSLRAWKFWLAPENRRWWWWDAQPADGEVRFKALVRSKPYLRGSLDWLWKVSPP